MQQIQQDEPVSLGEIAREWGITKSAVKRYASKRGFTHYVIVRRDATHQAANAFLAQDADKLREIRRREGFAFPKSEIHVESR